MKIKITFVLILGMMFSLGSVVAFAGGDGTEEDPYQISTCQELQDMNTCLDCHYVLVNDIDCSDTREWNWVDGFCRSDDSLSEEDCHRLEWVSGHFQGFEPITGECIATTSFGVCSQYPIFEGSLDGKNNTISGLYIFFGGMNLYGGLHFHSRRPTGLIVLSNGTISNVNLIDVNITGGGSVGGLVAAASPGKKIINSHLNGSVSGFGGVGGLVGGIVSEIETSQGISYVQYNVLIEKSSFSGIVSASNLFQRSGFSRAFGSTVGGLVGGNNWGVIKDSFSEGSVFGEGHYTGGLVGTSSGTILNSNSSSRVEGNWDVGGLVGSFSGGNIINSHATGNVYGNRRTGGFIGVISSRGEINNSYTTGDVLGRSKTGGFVGLMRSDGARISNSYSRGNVVGYGTEASKEVTGGFAGSLEPSSFSDYSPWITNSYSTGDVSYFHRTDTIPNPSNKGFIGKNSGRDLYGVRISGNYFDTQTSQQTSGLGATGKSTAEMKQQLTFEGWDFDTIWNIDPDINDGYPHLRMQESPPIGSLQATRWLDLLGDPITETGIDSTVLMSSGMNVGQDQNITFNVTVLDSSNWFTRLFRIRTWNNLFGTSSGGGYETFIVNESKPYKFKVNIDGVVNESDVLDVSGTHNARPSTRIYFSSGEIDPFGSFINEFNEFEQDGNYYKSYIGEQLTFTHETADPDDLLTLTWNLDNGTTKEFHNYSFFLTPNLGQFTTSFSEGARYYNVRLRADEMTRNQYAEDSALIYVFKEGVNVVPVISTPEKGSSFESGNIFFNISRSYVANCSSTDFEDNPNFTVGNLNCIYLHSPGERTTPGYNLTINWDLDSRNPDTKTRTGNWEDDYDSLVEFVFPFKEAGPRTSNVVIRYGG